MNSDLQAETRLMYSVRSAAELKPDVVVVVGAVVVEPDEVDVADAAVAVVDARLLSTDLLLQYTIITAYQQRRRMTKVVTRHLLLIQPFRILVEVMQATNLVATLMDAVMLVTDPRHVMSNMFVRFDRFMQCYLRVPQTERNLTHMLILVLLAQTLCFMQRLGRR